MGIIRGGVLGGFRNKTGAVVGAYWRKLDVIRGLPRKSNKTPTQLQLDQQGKFRLVTGFLSWISTLIDTGFKSVSNISTPMNVAVAYHLKEAITGVSPNFNINYPKVKFSVGKLELPDDLQVAGTVPGKLDFTWVHTGTDDKYLDATDRVSILVYNPLKDKFAKVVNIVARSAQAYSFTMPADFAGDSCHCYIALTSVKTKGLVSNSFHLGPITVL